MARATKDLGLAARDSKDAGERFRISRAVVLLNLLPKAPKVIDFGKGETLDEGILKYSFLKIVHAKDEGKQWLHLTVTNTSADTPIPATFWATRLAGAGFFNEPGRHPVEVKFGGGDRELAAGKSFTISGAIPRPHPAAQEYYVELARHLDKPDTVFLIPRDKFSEMLPAKKD